jgi:kynureninase
MNLDKALQTSLLLDREDKLAEYSESFLFPKFENKKAIYLCGNSLGLQPKTTKESVLQELEDWAQMGVEGHVNARSPWLTYHEQFSETLAHITGSKTNEVVAMNALTVNLHLLLATFYRPSPKRHRIICEAKAFPSDLYALQSQTVFHGFSPEKSLRIVSPKNGSEEINLNDILDAINEEGEQLSFVMIGGVNYYNGQVFDMQKITDAAHQVGAFAGFDLAHAIGNIELKLHDWNVDFAAWCSYKYLNSGPGGVAGVFIHEKHSSNPETFKLKGWWGNKLETRFKMEDTFIDIPTAESWQMSNAPVLSMAAHRASLKLFQQATMPALIDKSKKLTGFLSDLIEDLKSDVYFKEMFQVITPQERGCQLSLLFHKNGKEMFEHLNKNGVIADWREPNVIRIAPTPLYNSFNDVFHFVKIMESFKAKTYVK